MATTVTVYENMTLEELIRELHNKQRVIDHLNQELRAGPTRDPSAELLLRAVRDRWYIYTPYNQLKVDIDEYLDGPRAATGGEG